MAFELPQLPNFQTNVPQAPDALADYGKFIQLKDMLARQQLIPGQLQTQQANLQSIQTENELKQLQLQGQKALTQYWSDPTKYAGEMAGGANEQLAGILGLRPDDPLMDTIRGQMRAGVPAPMAFVEAKNALAVREQYNKSTKEQQAVMDGSLSHLQKIAAPILSETDPLKKSNLIELAKPELAEWARFDPSLNGIIPQLNGKNFDAFANMIAAQDESHKYLKGQAEAAEAAQKVINPATGMSPQQQAEAARDIAKAGPEAQARLNVESSPQALQLLAQKAAIEATARQQAAQGDPNVAGKMLADGSLTIADLKTRGTTPQFIEQATLAAQKLKPGYSPADEVIAEQVAKSQTANQFFGSANSLIQKGGTLDQLETLAKKIPQNKLPVLNTLEDWQKLATGKGPLAGYAATALGVADDYGKVMGGGTASDHARDAALRLFAAAQSPEQRASAIQSTRDAVQSQRDSRIGNNQFLKRAYGAETGGTAKNAPAAGMIRARDPQGVLHEAKAGTALPTGWTLEK